MKFTSILINTVAALFLLTSGAHAQNSGIRYFYDDLGRLVTVIDPSGNAASYSYDGVGNILKITRTTIAPNSLAVNNILPRSGSVGTAITIQGQGFSATPASNSVQFNGVVATVVSASASQLVAAVPVGATSGPLSVTVAGVSAQGGNFTVLQPVVIAINVTAPLPIVQVGASEQYVATGILDNGTTQDLTTAVTWSSSNAAAATISNAAGSQGLALGAGAGTAVITATLGSVSGSATLRVSTIKSIVIKPAVLTVRIPTGSTQQLAALSIFNDGSSQDVSNTVAWSSNFPATATVNNAGLTTAVAIGTSQITATLGSGSSAVSGSISVSVVSMTRVTVMPQRIAQPQGIGQRFTANATFSDGVTQDITNAVSWSSSDIQIASVVDAPSTKGQVSAIAPGPVTITATFSDLVRSGTVAPVSGTAPLEVNGAATSVSPRFAYSPNVHDGTISQYTVDASTGQLRPNGYLFDGINRSIAGIAVDSAGRFAFVTDDSIDSISAFKIDATTAALAPVTGSPFRVTPGATTAQNPVAVAVDPLGRFVYSANQSAASVSGFKIDPTTGALTPVPGSPFVGGTGTPTEQPFALAIDPASKFLLVVEHGFNKVAVYSINQQTGSLTEIPSSPFATGSSPVSVAIHASGKFAYVGNSSDRTLSEFNLDPNTGVLTSIGSISAGAFNAATTLALAPSGQFAYVQNPSSIQVFSINPSNGSLTPVSGSPFDTSPVNGTVIVADPSGRFVYTSDPQSSQVATVGIDPNTGALVSLGNLAARVSPLSMAMSSGAAAVAHVPKFAYVANSGANNVTAYTIAPATEALVPVTGSPFADGFTPVNIISDPAGKFAFVANKCSDIACSTLIGSVSIYSVDSVTGSLTAVPGSPFSVGRSPAGPAVDPSGRFVYVVNNQDNSISSFSVNPGTGALSAIAGSPFPTDPSPLGISIAPTGDFAYVLSSCSPTICSSGHEVSVYAINGTTGVLSLVQSFGELSLAQSETVDPFSRFVFLATQCFTLCGPGGVSVYTVNAATGVLSMVTTSQFRQPFGAGNSPVSPVVDPSGRFLYVANSGDNTVSGYFIDQFTGALWPISGSPFAVGKSPNSVAIDASGLTLYVANTGDGTVSAFAIDPVLGVLSPLGGSPFPAGTSPVSITTTRKIQ
jgi:6-phosphogluconolactonase